MGHFSTATGIATFTMMLLSQFIVERHRWGIATNITPTNIFSKKVLNTVYFIPAKKWPTFPFRRTPRLKGRKPFMLFETH
ncbi:hypothetical protein K1719_018767 [Acacia pycnantha]|nr:hypothetical protein K1719_018767 [Acacia pycnantha]